MSRIRTIKPGFWKNEELASIHPESALLAIGLLNFADDEGYFRHHPKLISSEIFPLRECSVNVQTMLKELENIGYFTLYLGVDDKEYGHINGFTKHQKVNRAYPSEIKEKIELTDNSVNDHEQLTVGKGKGKGKGIGKEGGEKTPKCKPKTEFKLPEEIPEKLWSAWMDIRVKKKAINSDIAKAALLTKLEKCKAAGFGYEQSITLAIENSWKSIEPEWIQNLKGNNNQQRPVIEGASNKPFPEPKVIKDTPELREAKAKFSEFANAMRGQGL